MGVSKMKIQLMLTMSVLGLKANSYNFLYRIVRIAAYNKNKAHFQEVFQDFYNSIARLTIFADVPHYVRYKAILQALQDEGFHCDWSFLDLSELVGLRKQIISVINSIQFRGHHNDMFNRVIKNLEKKISVASFKKHVCFIYGTVSKQLLSTGSCLMPNDDFMLGLC